MKTSLEFDTNLNQFIPKPSQLQVVMLDENQQKVIIGESEFDLAKFSTPQQVNEQVVLEPRADNRVFELSYGQDHIEITVKTVDLGDSETPGSTVGRTSTSSTNRSSNRASARRR